MEPNSGRSSTHVHAWMCACVRCAATVMGVRALESALGVGGCGEGVGVVVGSQAAFSNGGQSLLWQSDSRRSGDAS